MPLPYLTGAESLHLTPRENKKQVLINHNFATLIYNHFYSIVKLSREKWLLTVCMSMTTTNVLENIGQNSAAG